MTTDRNRAHRLWRLLWVGLPLLVVGTVGYICIDYGRRYVHGFHQVEEVRLIANALGGYLDQGVRDGDFYLHLEGTSVTDQQLKDIALKLSAFPPPYLDQNHRIEVYLSGTAVTDQGVASLAGVHRLVGLDLNDTRVTDAGVDAIGDLDLQTIGLRNTPVTEKIVPVLALMQGLWRVDLENTAVSREAQRKLADALPYWPDLDQKGQALLAEPPLKQ